MNEDDLVAAVALLLKLAELDAERPCSSARLAKRAGLPMSALMRDLAMLEELGLVERDEAGGIVRPSAEGRAWCAQLGRDVTIVPGTDSGR
jgi:DNA-binding IclR family transcriptional regulator